MAVVVALVVAPLARAPAVAVPGAIVQGPRRAVAGAPVRFDVVVLGGTSGALRVDFGDGSSAAVGTRAVTGGAATASVRHRFPRAGRFRVTVRSATGAIVGDGVAVTVAPHPADRVVRPDATALRSPIGVGVPGDDPARSRILVGPNVPATPASDDAARSSPVAPGVGEVPAAATAPATPTAAPPLTGTAASTRSLLTAPPIAPTSPTVPLSPTAPSAPSAPVPPTATPGPTTGDR